MKCSKRVEVGGLRATLVPFILPITLPNNPTKQTYLGWLLVAVLVPGYALMIWLCVKEWRAEANRYEEIAEKALEMVNLGQKFETKNPLHAPAHAPCDMYCLVHSLLLLYARQVSLSM